VVLVEGHKETPLTKVWLASSTGEAPPPEAANIAEVLPWGGQRLERAEELVLARLTTAREATPVVGGVLVGGASRRMGHPKQMIEVTGVTMAERVAAALEPHVDEVVLLGGGDVPRALDGLRSLIDAPGIAGPLAGILAATRWAPHAAWVIAACDLPRIDARAVRWLLDQRRLGRWAVLPKLEIGLEPLLALYEPQAGDLLEDLAAAGEAAPRLLAEHPEVGTPTPPDELAGHWSNANTPQDLASLAAG
jgi:molybdopterin-guanine dinucleotide biosynthesis protein A